MLNVREIKEIDLNNLEKLYEKSVQDNQDGFIQKLDIFLNIKNFVLDSKKNNGNFLGVFIDEELVGMGGFINKGNSVAEICKLHIDKKHKGKKYGFELFKQIEKKIKDFGYRKVTLHVTKTQTQAINLYEKNNYKITKQDIYKIIIDEKEYSYDTIYMEKDI